MRWTYRKLSIESGTNLYFLNFPLSVSFPLSVTLSPVSSLAALSQLWQTVTVLPLNLSTVVLGSVLSPTLFLLFINELSVTICHIHPYGDDSTLHFSTSFDRRPTLQDLQDSRLEAAERLTSDLALISDWGKRNLVSLMPQKLSFFINLIDITFQTSIPYSSTTHSYHPLQH